MVEKGVKGHIQDELRRDNPRKKRTLLGSFSLTNSERIVKDWLMAWIGNWNCMSESDYSAEWKKRRGPRERIRTKVFLLFRLFYSSNSLTTNWMGIVQHSCVPISLTEWLKTNSWLWRIFLKEFAQIFVWCLCWWFCRHLQLQLRVLTIRLSARTSPFCYSSTLHYEWYIVTTDF